MYHIKYRPTKLRDVIGNKEIVASIKNIVKQKEKAQAFLFSGSSGCGKTTLARILAKKLGAVEQSIVELNVANTRGIDTVRDIIRESQFGHISGSSKVYIYDEFHTATREAQEALLKLIEDAPLHSYFIFCSTSPERIIETIRNRCVKYSVRALSDSESMQLLRNVCSSENIEVDERILKLIVEHSGRIPRTLLVNLYECKDLEYEQAKALLENTAEGVKTEVIEICRMLIRPKDIKWPDLMKKIDTILQVDSGESVRKMMFAYFASVLRNAKKESQVFLYTAILEVLDAYIKDNEQAKNSLVYLLGKIYCGVISYEEK